jgi:hypothetical protein
VDQLLQDIKFGVRLLWKDKAFSLTVLLTLMICVAANVAIFTIVYSVILRPLPVPEASRIVLLYNSYPNAGVERAATSIPDYYDRLRRRALPSAGLRAPSASPAPSPRHPSSASGEWRLSPAASSVKTKAKLAGTASSC